MEVQIGSPLYQRLSRPSGQFTYGSSIAASEEFPTQVGSIGHTTWTDKNVLSYQWQITYRVTAVIAVTRKGEERVTLSDGFQVTIARYVVTCEIISATAEGM